MKRILFALVEGMIADLRGPLGMRLRAAYYRTRCRAVGRNVRIGIGVVLSNPEYIEIADNCWIDDRVSVLAGPPGRSGRRVVERHPEGARPAEGTVRIGRNCHIAIGVVLQGHGGLEIGENCTIASGSMIYTLSHHYRNPDDRADTTVYKFSTMAPRDEQMLVVGAVVIGANAAVGLNSVVLPGSRIGDNSWVGVAAVVRGEIPAGMIASAGGELALKQRS